MIEAGFGYTPDRILYEAMARVNGHIAHHCTLSRRNKLSFLLFLMFFLLAQNLDFGVDCDSRVAIVGPNGAGRVALKKSGYAAGLDSSGVL